MFTVAKCVECITQTPLQFEAFNQRRDNHINAIITGVHTGITYTKQQLLLLIYIYIYNHTIVAFVDTYLKHKIIAFADTYITHTNNNFFC